MAAPGVGFTAERTPDPAWQERLDQVFPRAANGCGLVIRWGPGEPEAPTQRWVIDQMLPVDQCWVRDYREGRDVPLGPMAQYLQAVERHRGKPWPLWLQRFHAVKEATGCLPVPFWIVQGDRGGHKLRYETADRILAQGMTGETEPPAPGALPYAPFDERVIAGLVRADRFRGHFLSVLAEKEYREAEAEREVRRQLQGHLDGTLSETLTEILPGLLARDLPRTDTAPDYAEAVARYDETGELDAALTGSLSVGRPAPLLTRR